MSDSSNSVDKLVLVDSIRDIIENNSTYDSLVLALKKFLSDNLPKTKHKVTLFETRSITIDVMATNDEEAQDLANKQYDEGELDFYDGEVTEHGISDIIESE